VQGLFAIIEFETENSATRALEHNADILLRGSRLVVRRRNVRRHDAPPNDDPDNSDGVTAEQSAGVLHNELLSKLAACGNVRILVVHLLY